MMAGAGFEPAKAEPMRLQRIPFDRSGTPPERVEDSGQPPSGERRGRPASISNAAYFGPPSASPEPAHTRCDGMYQRRPSATSTNSRSQRFALKRLTSPFQLRLPPRVQIVTSQRP